MKQPLVTLVVAGAICLLPSRLLQAQQMGLLDGYVYGPGNVPAVGAIVGFDASERSSHTETKTDKKGYFQLNLLPGTYNVTVTADGKVRAHRYLFMVTPGPQDLTNFANGNTSLGLIFRLNPPDGPVVELRSEVEGNMEAAEDKKAGKAAATELALTKTASAAASADRQAELEKKQALNNAYAAGKAAMDAKQYDDAITNLNKANGIDASQPVVWILLADAYMARSGVRGADKAGDLDKADEAYRKAIELKPTDASYYNNYALSLAQRGKIDDAKTNLAKAIQLDPGGAGTYHYNLAEFLLKGSQTDDAIAEFHKSIEADPAHASSYFELGVALAGKATADASGKMQPFPGTVEALQKYLELQPNGLNAQAAKDMIAAMGGRIQATYKDPNAKTPATKK